MLTATKKLHDWYGILHLSGVSELKPVTLFPTLRDLSNYLMKHEIITVIREYFSER